MVTFFYGMQTKKRKTLDTHNDAVCIQRRYFNDSTAKRMREAFPRCGPDQIECFADMADFCQPMAKNNPFFANTHKTITDAIIAAKKDATSSSRIMWVTQVGCIEWTGPTGQYFYKDYKRIHVRKFFYNLSFETSDCNHDRFIQCCGQRNCINPMHNIRVTKKRFFAFKKEKKKVMQHLQKRFDVCNNESKQSAEIAARITALRKVCLESIPER